MTAETRQPARPEAVAGTRPMTPVAPAVPRTGALRPLGVDEVRLEGGFWGSRQELNRSTTIPHAEHWVEEMGWAPNFDRAAAGTLPDGRRGTEFADSEVYKLLEGMAWEIGRTGDEALDERLRRLAARVAAAQEDDGYLHTAFGRDGQPPRWSNLEWGHELYCVGHLIQAGVARLRTHGEDQLVRVAVAAADHVSAEFGDPTDTRIGGHPEIETALAELSRATDEPRYLELARLFVERRGRGYLGEIGFGPEYFQDDVPVREAEVLRGHAVRALYLASGAVDVGVDTGDAELIAAVARQMGATLARRTYLTGAMGSQHDGEAFGGDFMLPPDRAYAESCAGIAAVQTSHRLLLHDADARHADVVERTMYNVVAAAVGEDGASFFYTNPLHQRTVGRMPAPEEVSPRAASSVRAPWFAVSCCPTNLIRTIASLGSLLGGVGGEDGHEVHLHQLMPATVRTRLDDGETVSLQLRTAYPDDGRMTVTALEAPADGAPVRLRVPSWATGARLVGPDGEARAVPAGEMTEPMRLRAGESMTLELPVEPRLTRADPRVDAVRGQVAVEQGPLVLALESPDLAAAGLADDVAAAELLTDRAPERRDGRIWATVRTRPLPEAAWPYRSTADEDDGAAGVGGSGATSGEQAEVALIPYHAWANRGPSTMRVWIPEA
ncbi:glycoside hydrolase family 127 protein [Nesterenkonia sp. F]|uniref:glycoside hydrolase family 127 protein n=1 Tax=Nesterenkonia sp. F TaxID=795955 RepID=UPI000255D06E|nr:beta-L-arabinofuranosidase domain-containing protein [Nesterenkonia sp. F]